MIGFTSNIEVRLSNIGLSSPDNYIREEYSASATGTATGSNINSLIKNSKKLAQKLCIDLFYAYAKTKFVINFIGVINITIKNKDGNIIKTIIDPFKLTPNYVGIDEDQQCLPPTECSPFCYCD
jgi:hypothetical protein